MRCCVPRAAARKPSAMGVAMTAKCSAQNSVASRDRVQLGALDREGRRVVFQSMSDVSGEGRHDRHRVDESATVDRARGMLRPVRPALGGAHAGAPAAPGWRGHERLGAGPYERVPERTGQRNGTDPDCPTPGRGRSSSAPQAASDCTSSPPMPPGRQGGGRHHPHGATCSAAPGAPGLGPPGPCPAPCRRDRGHLHLNVFERPDEASDTEPAVVGMPPPGGELPEGGRDPCRDRDRRARLPRLLREHRTKVGSATRPERLNQGRSRHRRRQHLPTPTSGRSPAVLSRDHTMRRLLGPSRAHPSSALLKEGPVE